MIGRDERDAHHTSDRPHQMYGLVLGIRVAPRGAARPIAARAARAIRLARAREAERVRRRTGLRVRARRHRRDDSSGAMPVPGPTLVLERGQPVAITIVNQSQDRAAVHWHGIELESYPDGVPGWSGGADNVMPPFAPGDSFTVRFTPPRAGTFMYHSHFNEFHQITSGLYGALVVVDSTHAADRRRRPSLDLQRSWANDQRRDRAFPARDDERRFGAAAARLRGWKHYRLRLSTFAVTRRWYFTYAGRLAAHLARGGQGRRGLAGSQATDRPAMLAFDPGEIYDFDFTAPASGSTRCALGFSDGNKPVTMATSPSGCIE